MSAPDVRPEIRPCPACGLDSMVVQRVRVHTDPPLLLIRTRCLLGHIYDDFEDGGP